MTADMVTWSALKVRNSLSTAVQITNGGLPPLHWGVNEREMTTWQIRKGGWDRLSDVSPSRPLSPRQSVCSCRFFRFCTGHSTYGGFTTLVRCSTRHSEGASERGRRCMTHGAAWREALFHRVPDVPRFSPGSVLNAHQACGEFRNHRARVVQQEMTFPGLSAEDDGIRRTASLLI